MVSNLPASGKTDLGRLKIERVTKEIIYEDMLEEDKEQHLQPVRIEDYILNKSLLLRDDNLCFESSIYKADNLASDNISWSRSEGFDDCETINEEAGLLS